MSELKPCPFCGGKAEQYVSLSYSIERSVGCTECGADAVGSDWNTRPIEDALLARAEAAELELVELKERMRWIPVGERLPEERNSYLVLYHKTKTSYMAETIWHPETGWVNPCGITHWMPLPEPTKEND